jgi:hypothetical protein
MAQVQRRYANGGSSKGCPVMNSSDKSPCHIIFMAVQSVDELGIELGFCAVSGELIGNVNQKVVPTPGVLETPTSPL